MSSLLSAAAPRLTWQDPSASQALRAIVPNDPAGGPGVYTLSGQETIIVESLSADVDASAAANDTQVQVDLSDPTGLLLARVRSVSAIQAGSTGQATFAPQLADTASLPPPISGTNIQAALFSTTIQPLSTIAVTATEPGAVVTQVRLWVIDATDQPGEVKPFPYRLAHVPL